MEVARVSQIWHNIFSMAEGFSSPDLESSRSQSESATRASSEAAANVYKMPDLLRQAVSERFKASPLTQQFGGAAQDFLAAIPQERANLANLAQTGQAVMSPNQQQAVLASTRAANLIPLISLNDLLQSQFGKSDELVGAGTRSYQAYAQGLQSQAEIARQKLNDLITGSIAGREADLAERKFQEEIRQFNESQKTKGSSGTGLIGGLAGLLSQIGVTPTSSAVSPQFSPATGPGTGYEDDSGNLWEFQADGTWRQI